MSERELAYQNAQEHVKRVRGFYIHLIVYLAVNLLLFVINRVVTPDTLWHIWPLGGWGIGVFFHALSVFGRKQFLGAEWEKQQIEKTLRQTRE